MGVLADRYERIAWAHTPPDVSIVIHDPLRGTAFFRDRLMLVPYPKTARALYIYLHECAHFVLHDTPKGHSLISHRREYEAESWARLTLLENGIPIPDAEDKRARLYVASRIALAIKGGAKVIDREAASFAAAMLPSRRVLREGDILTWVSRGLHPFYMDDGSTEYGHNIKSAPLGVTPFCWSTPSVWLRDSHCQ